MENTNVDGAVLNVYGNKGLFRFVLSNRFLFLDKVRSVYILIFLYMPDGFNVMKN